MKWATWMSVLKSFVLLTGFLMHAAVFAADGDLDPDFGTGGKVTLDIATWDVINDFEVLADGSIVAAGRSWINSQFDTVLAKFDKNGNVVGEFGANGFVITDFGNGEYDLATAIHALPNGKLLIAGAADGDFLLAQYNANGTLDSNFGTGGFVTTDISFNKSDIAFAVAVQSTGRIVVSGRAEGISASESFVGLAGYTSNGVLDPTFGVNGTLYVHVAGNEESPSDMILLEDNRILVTGDIDFNPPPLNAKFFVARFTASGFPDPSFGNNGASVIDLTSGADFATAIAAQPDGKIVLGGFVSEGPSDGTQDLALVRLESDGDPDLTFGNGGVVIQDLGGDLLPGNDRIEDIAIQSDGKIVAIGRSDLPSSNGHFLLARFLTNGALDSTLDGGVIFTNFSPDDDSAQSLFLSNDSIIAAGSSDIGNGDMAIARYLRTTDPPPTDDCANALFCDLFDDGVLAANWNYLKPSWVETNGALRGSPSGKKAIAIAPNGWASSNVYSVHTSMKSSGGEFSSLWLLGWYVDKKNTIELQMKEGSDKWILKHRVNGVVVAKAKGLKAIQPGASYSVKIHFDGSQFQVFVDDPINPLITLTATHPVAAGTAGYQVKNSAASFDSIRVD